MYKLLIRGFAVVALAGCATIPDIDYRYFPAKASTEVSVTQTIDCSPDKSKVNFFYTPTVVTIYSSDRSKQPNVLRVKELRSAVSDADITFNWFDDGRLKSVNQSSTGQGENIVKAAMTFLAPIIGGAALVASDCTEVSTLGGGKPLTIIYSGTFDYGKSQINNAVPLQANSNSKSTYELLKSRLKATLPVIAFRARAAGDIPTLVHTNEDASEANSTVSLVLNKTVVSPIDILVDSVPFWSGKAVVPTTDTYVLPIPKPKLFGKQAFALTLNEAGGIVTMGYTSLSGAAGALNALNAVSTTLSPSDAAKAAAIKSEADVIAQTQRLAACQAKPADCK